MPSQHVLPTIFVGFSASNFHAYNSLQITASAQRAHAAPFPVPLHVSASKAGGPPKLSDSYLPAVMQAIAYYVELIQYEPLYTTTIEPPYSLASGPLHDMSQSTPPSAKPMLSVTTTPRPTSTQRPTPTTPSFGNIELTTPHHKPGYFAPERPPHSSSAVAANDKPSTTKQPPRVTAPTRKPALTGNLPILSISNAPYFDYFFHQRRLLQRKSGELIFGKKENRKSEAKESISLRNRAFEQFSSALSPRFLPTEFEFLHQLPADLLQDIESEPYDSSARTDTEAVNAFRKIYDDFYERIRYSTALAGPQTGKKRVPPTKPYVLFLFLYDQLKREATRLNLQEFVVRNGSETAYNDFKSVLMRMWCFFCFSASRRVTVRRC